ncbi:MAG TPA: protein kinase [Steroidobacteraceae bacterium]|nr:protein kinase [Steroidobacteraceae bacterium]
MRLLLIVQDARYRTLLRHHVSCEWPDATVEHRSTRLTAPLPPEYLAQGYDVVVLDEDWQDGQGLAWLRDLALRRGFAPIVFLARDSDSRSAREARLCGAFGVICRRRFPHATFIAVLEEAARMQRRALADWRISPAAEASRRFGPVRIPGYRCVRRLAGGSSSQLYLAESEKAGALLVVKITPSLRDAEGVDQAFERFLQEYEIAHRLHHSSIVRCHELGVADDHAYLAMDYYPDGDLRKRIRAGVLPADALELAAQIAGALVALHEAGALHRDLKPGNVLMRGPLRVVLTDFGLAKHAAIEADITDPGVIFGTPTYMSPEQGHGETVDERSDLYSLGVILYEMLAGEKPFTDNNPMAIIYKHRNAPVPRLPQPAAQWQGLVDTLMAKRPADRYSTAAQVESVLREAAQAARAAAA